MLNEHLVYCVNTSGTRSALSCDNNTLQPMRWYKFVCLLLYYKYCWSNILTYILTFFHVVLICVPNIEKNDDKVELKWLNICSCCTGVYWLSDQVAGEKKKLHEIWHDGISLPDMHGLESKKKVTFWPQFVIFSRCLIAFVRCSTSKIKQTLICERKKVTVRKYVFLKKVINRWLASVQWPDDWSVANSDIDTEDEVIYSFSCSS